VIDRLERLRVHGLLRSAIIGYGIAAYWLLAPASDAGAGYRYMLLVGIGVQLLVLLFALATYGSLIRYAGTL
jgi:hypothetical protein